MNKLKDKTDSSQKTREGFRALVLVALSPNAYHNPHKIANTLARYKEVESVDIVAGNWEMILQIRTKDQNKFYEFLKKVASEDIGIIKTSSIISLKQVKPFSS